MHLVAGLLFEGRGQYREYFFRRAARQNQLAAVGIDVGGQERDVLLFGRCLHDSDETIKRLGRRLSAAFQDQRIGSFET